MREVCGVCEVCEVCDEVARGDVGSGPARLTSPLAVGLLGPVLFSMVPLHASRALRSFDSSLRSMDDVAVGRTDLVILARIAESLPRIRRPILGRFVRHHHPSGRSAGETHIRTKPGAQRGIPILGRSAADMSSLPFDALLAHQSMQHVRAALTRGKRSLQSHASRARVSPNSRARVTPGEKTPAMKARSLPRSEASSASVMSVVPARRPRGRWGLVQLGAGGGCCVGASDGL